VSNAQLAPAWYSPCDGSPEQLRRLRCIRVLAGVATILESMQQEDYRRVRVACRTIKHVYAIGLDPLDGCRRHGEVVIARRCALCPSWHRITDKVTSSPAQFWPQMGCQRDDALSKRNQLVQTILAFEVCRKESRKSRNVPDRSLTDFRHWQTTVGYAGASRRDGSKLSRRQRHWRCVCEDRSGPWHSKFFYL